MDSHIDRLIVYYQTTHTASEASSQETKLEFIRKNWCNEKASLLRTPNAFQCAIALGLPFTDYEWKGILPSTNASYIRLIPSVYDSFPPSSALAEIAGYGNHEGLLAFLEVLPPTHIKNEDLAKAMTRSMSHGRDECVKVLLNYIVPTVADFSSAVGFGHVAVIKLTSHLFTADVISQVTERAIRFGHINVIQYFLTNGLMEKDDIDKSYTLAYRYSQRGIVDLLAKYRT